jgi:hypothetical protein
MIACKAARRASPVSGSRSPVQANHALECLSGVQTPPSLQLVLAVEGLVSLRHPAPMGRHPLQVAHGMDAGHLDELTLTSTERHRVDVSGGDQHARRRHRQVSLFQRSSCPRQLPQAAGHPDLFSCPGPSHAECCRQPGSSGQVTIAPERCPGDRSPRTGEAAPSPASGRHVAARRSPPPPVHRAAMTGPQLAVGR